MPIEEQLMPARADVEKHERARKAIANGEQEFDGREIVLSSDLAREGAALIVRTQTVDDSVQPYRIHVLLANAASEFGLTCTAKGDSRSVVDAFAVLEAACLAIRVVPPAP